MSFCCGTDMLLTIASIRHEGTTITNVPVLFCLICEQIMVHPDAELAFEMLKEYAISDRVREADLYPHVSKKAQEFLYDPKNHVDYLKMDYVLQEQIDQALDLFGVAQSLNDPIWKEEIIQRIAVLKSKKPKV